MVGRDRVVQHWSGTYSVRIGSSQVRFSQEGDQTSRALSSFFFDFRNGAPELSRALEEIHAALYPSARLLGHSPNSTISSSYFDRVERELLSASRSGLLAIVPQPVSSPARRRVVDYQKLGPDGVEEEKEELSFLGIELIDEDGNPVGNVAYEVSLPDGHIRTGVLGASGKTTLRDVPAGQCKITFPDLDGASWDARKG